MTIARDQPPPHASRRSMDILVAVLAVWLFISPWVLAYGAADSWNTWIASAIIFLTALSSLSRPRLWQEQLNLVLGGWMFLSPWIFNGSTPSTGAARTPVRAFAFVDAFVVTIGPPATLGNPVGMSADLIGGHLERR